LLLKRDLESIQKELSTYDQVREQVFTISRTAVRLAGTSILEIHRGRLENSSLHDKGGWKVLEHIEEVAKTHTELLTSPSVTVAYQEFVEASSLFEFVERGKGPNSEGGQEQVIGVTYWVLLDVIG